MSNFPLQLLAEIMVDLTLLSTIIAGFAKSKFMWITVGIMILLGPYYLTAGTSQLPLGFELIEILAIIVFSSLVVLRCSIIVGLQALFVCNLG